MSERFEVFIAQKTSPYTWKKTRRLKPIQCRKQAKGLGGADFEIEQRKDSQTNFADSASDWAAGNYVKIVDTTRGDEDSPEATLWLGYFTPSSAQIFHGNVDEKGMVSADEIGFQLKDDIINYYLDERGNELIDPPPFNPFDNGRWIGNQSVAPSGSGLYPPDGSHLFSVQESNLSFSKTGNTGASTWEDELHVWSRKDVINAVVTSGNTTLNYSMVFPKTVDNNDYGYFADRSVPRSYDNYIRKPISDALENLIDDPYCYYIDYSSSLNGYDIVIYQKNNDVITNDYTPGLPTSAEKSIKIDNDAIEIAINDVQKPVDRVILRGGPIICCGTLSPWTDGNQATIEKDWSATDQDKYVKGAESGFATNIQDAEDFREEYRNVYRDFKIKEFDNGNQVDVIQVAEMPCINASTQKRYAFFPNFKIMDDDGLIDITPEIEKDFENNKSQHKTPNRLSMKWLKNLPIRRFDTNYDNTSSEGTQTDPNELYEAQVWGPTWDVSAPASPILNWVDYIKGTRIQKIQMRQTGYDIKLTAKIPELLAWRDTTGTIWSGGDVDSDGEWLTANNPGPSRFNPDDDDDTGETVGKTHFSRFGFSVACESGQRVEMQMTRQGVTNPRNIHVIEDESIQLWFVHKNTIYGWDYFKKDFKRFDADTFTRNDLNEGNEMLKNAFYYLAKERKSASLVYPLMNLDFTKTPYNNFEIGKFIRYLNDNGNTTDELIEVNSTIESIRYDFNVDAPRLEVSTEIAEVPLLKRLKTQSDLGVQGGIQYDSQKSYRAPVTKMNSKAVKGGKDLVIGDASLQGTGGGTTVESEPSMFIIEGANEIGYLSNLEGIKYVDSISSLSQPISAYQDFDLADTWEDGLGYGRNVYTDQQVIIVNSGDKGRLNFDLVVGKMVHCPFSTTVGDISGDNITAYVPLRTS